MTRNSPGNYFAKTRNCTDRLVRKVLVVIVTQVDNPDHSSGHFNQSVFEQINPNFKLLNKHVYRIQDLRGSQTTRIQEPGDLQDL